MNVVDIHTYRPRSPRPAIERIAIWQLLCLFFIVAGIWICEFAGRCGDRAPVDWITAARHTVIVLGVGVLAILPVYFYQRRYAHKLVTICSYCRRVQVDDEDWTAIEAYFADKTHATYSHGVCPDCRERVMTAYRTSHGAEQGAGAAVPTAVM